MKPQTYYCLNRNSMLAALREGKVLALNTMFNAPDWLQREAVPTLTSAFAPLKSFTTVLSEQAFEPEASRIVKFAGPAADTQTNPTDFQQGGSAITALEATVSHFSQPWPVSNTDLQSGIRLADLFAVNAQKLGAALMANVAFWFSTAAFPAAPVVSASSAFNLSDAALAYGAIPGGNKALLLSPTYFAQLAAQSGKAFNSGDAAHGWKNGIFEISGGWTGNVRGIGLNPSAIVCVSGLFAEMVANPFPHNLIGLPGLNITVEFNSWFDMPTRTAWNSLDVIFGSTVAQSNGAVLIQTP